MHPLDVSTNHQAADDLNTSQQALTPPMKPIQHHFSSGGHGVASASSAASPPWIGPGNIHGAQNGMQTPQSEPMRYSHSLPMSGSRPPPRHLYPSSSLYYQTPRQDDRDRFDSENDRDPSPDYHDVDSDGRPIARMRSHGLKRKSLGQPLSRSNSNQNLYSTSLQQYQNQYSSNSHSQHHYNSSHRSSSQNHLDQSQYQQHHDLNAAMPQSSIKLSCFPGRDNSNITSNPIPITRTLDTTEAMAMHLNESSKLVIEIHQPRSPQSYMQMASNGSSSNRASHSAIIQRSNSQPNIMLARSSSSILGQRRSPSLDRSSCEGSSTKKRTKAAVASASATATESFYTITSQGHGSGAQKPQNEASTAIQVFGVDYLANNDEDATMKDGQVHAEIGLGLSTMATSPTVEALRVAKGSSYALVEDQKKEMGIDYSMFTRVETAGWRILIPPNVVASFRSDEFGLMLKPKGIEEVEFAIGAEDQVQEQGSRHKHGTGQQ
ncbi:hypothetical protein BCR41DRAFT_387649 [Lobosporangium transversale]|uniref:Uncharacterized protein n=1 Tax=Lobosporangium transversale TaxID=64571 RepID=A0A1Y2GJT9_9FUNG|nr:hypothetical protein BCR41DRAFT_387916 [Lobosporangium transversale]XP_021879755.1 hypothetical protein BCR41DRAFT_387649 [Lobosporangium transversale]ORZ11033.1 hypothetical protein BCR41DRAFT_387916 [Lobosporangium transversale]ORZ11658.1 hypothetical protein BCR41DRAFT_387649 [Lobosporangium transversale]|eukprot:XP_021879550.1 hypothetical protein BCR41DRAFT_387916 [Lobosporangium transversale]